MSHQIKKVSIMLVVADSFLSFEVDVFVVRGAGDWQALALSFYHLRCFHVTETHTRRTSFFLHIRKILILLIKT